MQEKLGGLFGGRGRGRGGGGGGKAGFAGFGLVAIIVLVVWLFSGIYIVDAGKRGVVLRFGAFTQATMPGPHWHIPYPVERVEIVDVEQRRFIEIGYRSSGGGQAGVVVPREALMLTSDENIVNIQLAVQYQVNDPRQYLFNVRDPDAVLKQSGESALREVIGKSKMDFVLGEGRAEVVALTKALMQGILDQYNSGLLVSDVNMQDAQPPEEVQGAFSDAIKAREDRVRLKNEAEAYANEVIPKARGTAARQLQEAEAYREALVSKATGEASRFNQLLEEYNKAPEVTRKRLYLETMEAVLSRSSKVFLDSESTGNLMYLPVDQLLKRPREMPRYSAPEQSEDSSTEATSNEESFRPTRRTRESR
jgi:membrane protease subunit HflK